MKKIITTSAILITLFTTAIKAQGAHFNYKMTSTQGMDGNMSIYFSTAGSRTEMTMSSPKMPGGGITRTSISQKDKPNTTIILDDKNKTYSAIENKKNETTPTSNSTITVKVVGKEKVGNYNCIHSIVTRNAITSDYWTTKDVSDYNKYSAANAEKMMGSNTEIAELAKNNADGLIVKSVTNDTRGGTMTMQLVSMEKKDLAASLFEIPADYKKTETPAGFAPTIDAEKLKNMTPEERAKYIEELKKKYGAPEGNK